MLKEFREFAIKGNVVDMAVGIIIGGAFGKIVNSLVADVIMPPIGMLLGQVDFKDLAVTLKDATVDAAGAERALPSMLCLSRRRCTEEGIRIASRYFATVRRAISMPETRNRSTMVSSDRITAGSSASISCLM